MTLPADCTYLVTGNTLIKQNVTMTVAEGVTFKFSADKYLQVEGALVAVGTASKPIKFTRSSPASDWDGIRIKTQSGSTSNLTHVIIEYANAWEPDRMRALHVDQAQPMLRKVTLRNNLLPLYLSAGEGYTVTLKDSVITNNTGAAWLTFGMNILDNVTVQNNTSFYDAGALRICAGNVVRNSRLINNQTVAILVNQCSSEGETKIVDNYFEGNTYAIEDTEWKPLLIQGNDIEQNASGALLRIRSCNAVLTGNNLRNDTSYILSVEDGAGGCTVDAANNWWNTTDLTTIAAKIYDYQDDFNIPEVIFQPIASQRLP